MSYPIRDQQGLYFLTFTVVSWTDLFTRPVYKDLVIDSLRYCQQHKGLELYAYCPMTNHLHLIARAAEGHELSGIVRDSKKFTARALFKEMNQLPAESRRHLAADAGRRAQPQQRAFPALAAAQPQRRAAHRGDGAPAAASHARKPGAGGYLLQS